MILDGNLWRALLRQYFNDASFYCFTVEVVSMTVSAVFINRYLTYHSEYPTFWTRLRINAEFK